VLDVGSGSGILGILLAKKYKQLELYQSEIQSLFQFLSSKNSAINGINNHLVDGDFLDFDENMKFNLIVSNPPFYDKDVIQTANHNINIARYNNHLPLKSFIFKISQIIDQKYGKIFFCYDAKQIDNIIYYSKKYNLNIESMQFVYPNIHKDASLVLIFARYKTKGVTKILPPIIVFDGDKFTKTMQHIYKLTSTHSIKAKI
jgi:tRNA1(Val) A37 N6-methylase TrmN6